MQSFCSGHNKKMRHKKESIQVKLEEKTGHHLPEKCLLTVEYNSVYFW